MSILPHSLPGLPGARKCSKLAVKYVKGLRHVLNETALQRLRLFSVVGRRIRVDLICIYKVMHGLSMRRSFCCPHPHWTSKSYFQDSPAAVLNPLPSTCVKRSSSPVLEQTARGDCERFIRCTMAVPLPTSSALTLPPFHPVVSHPYAITATILGRLL